MTPPQPLFTPHEIVPPPLFVLHGGVPRGIFNKFTPDPKKTVLGGPVQSVTYRWVGRE